MSTNNYIRPVILASDVDESESKIRLVEVLKSEVYKDINLYTHKHVDAHEDMGNRTGNAVSSDTDENVDGAVIARYVAFREAELRTKIRFALTDVVNEYANDVITVDHEKFRFFLKVPGTFNDNTLRPLAEFFHRFLVYAALADWYAQFGMDKQAAIYESQLDDITKKIKNALTGGSIVKRPLQPFGPAYKIR